MTGKKREWEQVAVGTARLPVPGGWLYFVKSDTYGGGAAACFVPDKDAGKSSWRTAPIDELELSVRGHRCLVNEYIETVGDLVNKSDAELLRIPNFGRKSLREIHEALDRFFGREGVDTGEETMEEADSV